MTTVPADDRSGLALGVGIIMILLAFALICARLYVRKFVINSLGSDDYFIIAAFVPSLAMGCCIFIMTRFGLGKHTWTVDVEDSLLPYLKTFYILIIMYNIALGLIKLAILLQLYRIFTRRARKICTAVMTVVTMWSGGLVFVSIFTCHPVSAFWNKSVDGYCISNIPQWYINAAGNIVTDFVIFSLPIPVLWKLQLPRSQRYSLIAVFGLAFFTCSISLIRVAFLNLNADPFYDNVAAALWSLAELCCGIIASCLPALRPILWFLVPNSVRGNTLAESRGAGNHGAAGYGYRWTNDNSTNARASGVGDPSSVSSTSKDSASSNLSSPGLRRITSAENLRVSAYNMAFDFTEPTNYPSINSFIDSNDEELITTDQLPKREHVAGELSTEAASISGCQPMHGTYVEVIAVRPGTSGWEALEKSPPGITVQTDVILASERSP